MLRIEASYSAHAVRRRGLTFVQDTAAVVDTLVAARLAAPDTGWTRHFERFHGFDDQWATVVLASSRGALVHLRIHDTEPLSASAVHVQEIDAWMDARTFPDDPALPGLAGALGSMEAYEVVRYRPGRRCTVRGTLGGLPRFVKITPNASQIHTDARALWEASVGGAFDVAVAEPLGWDPATQAVHLGVVPGVPLAPMVLGGDGLSWSRRLGRALGRLSLAPLPASTVVDAGSQLARTERAMGRTARRIPALGPRLVRLMDCLGTYHDQLVPRPFLAVHGSPHLHQWLVSGDRLGLVDFDRFGLGDPELDIATYLAELDTEDQLEVSVRQHDDAMIGGFEEVGAPLDRTRLWLYRVHKGLAKVSRTALGLRADGDVRSARHLEPVEALVAAGPDR